MTIITTATLHADWLNYKNSRNTVKTMSKRKKKKYIRNQIHKCKGISGALSKVIRHTLPLKEVSKPFFTKDMEKLAEECNNYFLAVGEIKLRIPDHN